MHEVAAVKADYARIRGASRNHFLASRMAPGAALGAGRPCVGAAPRVRRALECRRLPPVRSDSFADILTDRTANDTISEYIRERIHGGPIPGRRRAACPQGLPVRHQLPPLETDYYEAFSRTT